MKYGIIYQGIDMQSPRHLRYVGKTNRTLEKRVSEHDTGNLHVDRAARNRRFVWSIIEVVSATTPDELKSKLKEREIHWIAELDTLHPNGYNHTGGGEGGTPCDATRQKMSESHRLRYDTDAGIQAVEHAWNVLGLRTLVDIATETGFSTRTVKKYLEELGIKPLTASEAARLINNTDADIQAVYDAWHVLGLRTLVDIATETGFSHPSVNKYLDGLGIKPLTASEAQRLRYDTDAGVQAVEHAWHVLGLRTLADIATETGFSTQTVKKYLEELGIEPLTLSEAQRTRRNTDAGIRCRRTRLAQTWITHSQRHRKRDKDIPSHRKEISRRNRD